MQSSPVLKIKTCKKMEIRTHNGSVESRIQKMMMMMRCSWLDLKALVKSSRSSRNNTLFVLDERKHQGDVLG